jgi:type III secretion protein L
MLHIPPRHFQLLPDQKILRHEEYAQFLKANQIVEAAHTQAENLIAQAQAQASQIIKDAQATYEQEKARGLKEGQEEGKLKISEAMADYVIRIGNNVTRFETKIIEMLTQALHQIIGEIAPQDLIVGVVQKSLQVVRSQKRVTIRVAPADLATMEDKMRTLKEQFPSIDVLDLSPDERLQPGDCMLETDVGIVDGRLDAQVQVIQKSLERWVK